MPLGAFTKLRKTAAGFAVSVCPSAWNISAPTGQIFIKFDIWVFFDNLSRKFRFRQCLTRIRVLYGKTCVYWWQHFALFFLQWGMFQTNVFNNFFPIIVSLSLYCGVGQATDDNIIRRMLIVYWIPKAINTHPQCLILNAFPLQQWFCERAWMSRCTFFGYLVTKRGPSQFCIGIS
jgi:hypothetical protein